MSAQGKQASQYFLYLLIGVAAVVLASLRAGPVLIPLIKLAMALVLPVMFISVGMAIAGRGNRLLWLSGNAALGGLGWFGLGRFGTGTEGDIWRDAGMLFGLIVCPIASLVGAWLLSRFHPAKP